MQVHSAINSQWKLIFVRRLENRVDFPFFEKMNKFVKKFKEFFQL